MSGLADGDDEGTLETGVISEVLAVDAVQLAEASDVSLEETANVGDLVHILNAARNEELFLLSDHAEADDLGMLPPATGCGLLVRDERFLGIATTRDLVANMVKSTVTGRPLAPDDNLMSIATPANLVCAVREGDTVNRLLNWMIPTGEGFRHIPYLDERNQPKGVFLLKHALRYALRFLEPDDDTTLLNLGLRDLENRVVDVNATIEDVVHCMNRHKRRSVFVVESTAAPMFNALGVISEWDLISAVLLHGRSLSTPVSEVMTRKVEGCDISSSVRAAAERMLELNHHQMMVTCAGYLVGLVSLRRIVDHITECFPSEIRCLEPRYPVGYTPYAQRDGG